MRKTNEALLAVIVVTALLAGVNGSGARAADATVREREKLRAARPERPGKAAGVNHSEIKELRKIPEEKRKALPKSLEAAQSEQRAIVRDRLRANAASSDRAAMMNKEVNKDGNKEAKGEAREQLRKVADEAKAGSITGRRRD